MVKIPHKRVSAKARHREAQRALLAVVKRYSDLPALELLAVAGNITGQLAGIATDAGHQRRQIMDTVIGNVQRGMAEHLDDV